MASEVDRYPQLGHLSLSCDVLGRLDPQAEWSENEGDGLGAIQGDVVASYREDKIINVRRHGRRGRRRGGTEEGMGDCPRDEGSK